MPKSKEVKRIEAIQRQALYYLDGHKAMPQEFPFHIRLHLQDTYSKLSDGGKYVVRDLLGRIDKEG